MTDPMRIVDIWTGKVTEVALHSLSFVHSHAPKGYAFAAYALRKDGQPKRNSLAGNFPMGVSRIARRFYGRYEFFDEEREREAAALRATIQELEDTLYLAKQALLARYFEGTDAEAHD